MKYRSVHFEDGKFVIDGYPDGSTVRALNHPLAEELARLSIFLGDLKQVELWIAAANAEPFASPSREGLAQAALVRFCCCFSKSKDKRGRRTKPLRPSDMLEKADRGLVDKLRYVRNKCVAHDEELYSLTMPLLVFDGDAGVIEAATIGLGTPFTGMSEWEDLKRLSKLVTEWVAQQYERAAKEIVETFSTIPVEVRRHWLDESSAPRIDVKQL